MKPRPIHLNLFLIRFPLTAIASILHRISGLGLFVLLPIMLWVWQETVSSPESYMGLSQAFEGSFCRAILWLFLTGFVYHCFAGIRHLLMDIGLGETRHLARLSAMLVMAISALVSIWLAVQLWS